MKTTVDISDVLLEAAREVAAREGVTLRALIERGLHRTIEELSRGPQQFKLRRASFKGKGLQDAYRDASWEAVRDAIYRGRGT